MSDPVNNLEVAQHNIRVFLDLLNANREALCGGQVAMMFLALKAAQIQTADELAYAADEVNTALQRYETVLRRTSELLEAKLTTPSD